MSNNKTLVEKLEAKQKKLKGEIAAAKRKEAAKAAGLHKKRCEIIGAAVVAELGDNEALRLQLEPVIDKRTTSAQHRKMLGLEAIKK